MRAVELTGGIPKQCGGQGTCCLCVRGGVGLWKCVYGSVGLCGGAGGVRVGWGVCGCVREGRCVCVCVLVRVCLVGRHISFEGRSRDCHDTHK